MAPRAIIAGGSIGGLFAATALRAAGWTVDIYERSNVELAGRGAGIVTHDVLIDAMRAVGAGLDDLGVKVTERVCFDRSGARIAALPYDQIVTSWDRIHRGLRRLVPEGRYHLDRHVTGYVEEPDGVRAQWADGESEPVDLLVGADGFRSAVRTQMLPAVAPEYAGYVVWRALTDEADLTPAAQEDIFPTFAFFAPSGTQIIGYPIAGPQNDLREGHRRYNFVWYASATPAILLDMLTDAAGVHHPVSIPPPLVRDDVLREMEMQAERMLPHPFVEILNRSERPFFTPIYDHHSPIMAQGRVAILGDAACVARPHVGMGVTKAAEDALALARLADPDAVASSLRQYSEDRVPASRRAHERARQLGGWIFADRPDNRDGRRNPRLDEIMRLTAATVG